MRLDHSWIAGHIPHHGRMCLLDEVIEWGAQHIRCASRTHRTADHPLASHGRLGIACGVEYAAQVMAVHGALTAGASGSRPQAGFLASLRDVRPQAQRLDDIATDLMCEALLLAGDGSSALYEFALRSADRLLLSGRATVVFDAEGRTQR
jgi:predicted hotdog family 3-hydroxylacyl-ACP dehydratase